MRPDVEANEQLLTWMGNVAQSADIMTNMLLHKETGPITNSMG
jgi:hypothetical protein